MFLLGGPRKRVALGSQRVVFAQRRALGDIGNLVGPFNTRCNVGKDSAVTKKPVQVPLDQAQRAAQVTCTPVGIYKGHSCFGSIRAELLTLIKEMIKTYRLFTF